MGADPEMGWPTTRRMITGMADAFLGRDSTIRQYPGDPMGQRFFPAIREAEAKQAIAALVAAFGPFPTLIVAQHRIDDGPKQVIDRNRLETTWHGRTLLHECDEMVWAPNV
jgi:hypothetical protein